MDKLPASLVRRWPTTVLIATTLLAGGYLLYQQWDLRSLHAEYDPLAAKYGGDVAVDPSNYHITRIPTADPMRFVWRIYAPPDAKISSVAIFGGGSSSGSSMSWDTEFISQICFRPTDDQVEVFQQVYGGSSLSRAGGKAVAKLFQDHWHELNIESFGEDGRLNEIPVAEPVTVLKITVPKEVQQQLEPETLDELLQQFNMVDDGVIFQFTFGTPAAIEFAGLDSLL